MGYQEELQENAKLGVGVLREFLSSKLPSEKFDRQKLQFANQAVGHYNRYLATQANSETVKLVAIRSISDDKNEIKKLIAGNVKLEL